MSLHEVERAIKRGGERLLQGALLLATAALAGDAATLTFRCAPQNDLYRAINSSGRIYPRFDRVEDAISAAPRRSGVAILADGYPAERTQISPAVLQEAAVSRQLATGELRAGVTFQLAGLRSVNIPLS